jgi:hypothetical protein
VRETVLKIWPEIEWIRDEALREKVIRTWILALERSALSAEDLDRIPFTLLAKGCTVSFLAHKRSVVHIAVESARAMLRFYGNQLPIDLDVLAAGAILIDVGKLLEYDLKDGSAVVGEAGKYVRHPFSGVGLAMACDVPPRVLHIIATHAKEGSLGKRSVEATIVHHADFMSFEPFVERIV